jgi:Fe(3+) dicitrate transport protein
LLYNNRIGAITPTGAAYRLITNVGSSISKGFEGYVGYSPFRSLGKPKQTDVQLFASYSYTDARYSANHKDAGTKGKKVENAPTHIFRGGITASYKKCVLTGQLSYVSDTYSDANNTSTPLANGQNGLIPAYTVIDVTGTYKLAKYFTLKAGINNLWNAVYFTRRSGGYPGPGALPADGRTFFISLGAKL